MAWESEWGRPLNITLYREERALIWDVLHDTRREKVLQMETYEKNNERDKIAIRHLENEIEMIDGIRHKMCVMY